MKRNTLLLVILAALVGTAVIVQKGNKNTFSGGGVKTRELLLPGLPTDGTIRKIEVKDGDKSISIDSSSGKWTVAERSGYPASVDKVRRVVQSLSELKIARGRPVTKESLAGLKLLAPDEGTADKAGMFVNLMNEKGDSVARFVLGNSIESTGGASTGNFMGGPSESRYVRIPKDEGVAWQVADNFSMELKPEPQEWIDKGFFDIRKLKDIRITAAKAEDSWGAQRKDENSEFTLLDPKDGDSLDTAKAGGLSFLFQNASFTDVLPKDKATGDFMKGATVAKINTFEDFSYEVKVLEKKDGKDAEGKTYLTFTVSANIAKERKPDKDEKEEDKKKKDEEFAARKKELEAKLQKEKTLEGWVYEVAGYTVSALTKKRSEVLRDKPQQQPPASPLKLPQSSAVTPPVSVPMPAGAPAAPVTPPAAPVQPAPVKPADEKSPEPKADAAPAPAKTPEAPKPEAPKTEDKPAEKKP